MKLSPEDLRSIAVELVDLGFGKSEAYPFEKWRKNGWPEDPLSFKIIDANIGLIRLLEQYSLSGSR